jgi:hypothetical protein
MVNPVILINTTTRIEVAIIFVTQAVEISIYAILHFAPLRAGSVFFASVRRAHARELGWTSLKQAIRDGQKTCEGLSELRIDWDRVIACTDADCHRRAAASL